MTSSITPLDLDDLARHQAWLRRFARSLVGDDRADDAVQDTFEAALRSPPPADRPVRPWLARVLRNSIKMRWRADDRRDRREEASPAPETVPSADELVDRTRTGELLARLVVDLDEPFRQTVLLRYSEGLSAAAIARAHDIPAGTVRWRLSRGLEILRARLDERSGGDRHAWRLALLPFGVPRGGEASLASAATAGALAVKTKTAAFALVALAAAGAGVFHLSDRAAEPASAAPEASGLDAPPPAPRSHAAAAPVPAEADDPVRARHATLLARLEVARRQREQAAAAAPATNEGPSDRPRPELDVAKLDKDYIRDGVQGVLPLVRDCYERALERKPDLAGRSVVEFVIVGEEEVGGLVASSTYLAEDSTIDDPGFTECIQESMYAVEFPAPPEGGGQVVVRYPFTFAPSGGSDE